VYSLGDYGADKADPCAKAKATRKKYLDLMWKTPLFTKKRVAYEKKANAALRTLNACKKRNKGKGTAGKTVANLKPWQLWRMDPASRPINVLGFFTGTMAGGEDEVIVVASGARTSFKNRASDDRATIKAGVEILSALGVEPYTSVNVKALRVAIVQGDKVDKALIQAAGGGGSLKGAANKIRKAVTKYGKGAETAAWGARGLYLLGLLEGFAVVRGTASAIAAAAGPIGLAISAAMSGHGAISASVAQAQVAKFQGYVKSGLRDARAALAKKGGSSAAADDIVAAAGEALDPGLAVSVDRSTGRNAGASTKTAWIVGGVVGIVVLLVAANAGKGGNQ
jgi:hypothetical protein